MSVIAQNGVDLVSVSNNLLRSGFWNSAKAGGHFLVRFTAGEVEFGASYLVSYRENPHENEGYPCIGSVGRAGETQYFRAKQNAERLHGAS